MTLNLFYGQRLSSYRSLVLLCPSLPFLPYLLCFYFYMKLNLFFTQLYFSLLFFVPSFIFICSSLNIPPLFPSTYLKYSFLFSIHFFSSLLSSHFQPFIPTPSFHHLNFLHIFQLFSDLISSHGMECNRWDSSYTQQQMGCRASSTHRKGHGAFA